MLNSETIKHDNSQKNACKFVVKITSETPKVGVSKPYCPQVEKYDEYSKTQRLYLYILYMTPRVCV